jgi:acetyl esterase/lipase
MTTPRRVLPDQEVADAVESGEQLMASYASIAGGSAGAQLTLNLAHSLQVSRAALRSTITVLHDELHSDADAATCTTSRCREIRAALGDAP